METTQATIPTPTLTISTKPPMTAREMALFFDGPGTRPCRTATGHDIGCPDGCKVGDFCTASQSRCILKTPSYDERLKEAHQRQQERNQAKKAQAARVFEPGEDAPEVGTLAVLVERKPKRRSWATYKARG
jgi:hypothetical protein